MAAKFKISEAAVCDFRRAFNKIDADGGGTLSPQELRTAIAKLPGGGRQVTLQEAKKLVAEVDTDGSGEIDFEAFISLQVKPKSGGNFSSWAVGLFSSGSGGSPGASSSGGGQRRPSGSGGESQPAVTVLSSADRALALRLGLADRKVGELRTAFNLIDADGGGSLSAEELRDALAKLGGKKKVSLKDARAMVSEADIGGSGEITFEEARFFSFGALVVIASTQSCALGLLSRHLPRFSPRLARHPPDRTIEHAEEERGSNHEAQRHLPVLLAALRSRERKRRGAQTTRRSAIRPSSSPPFDRERGRGGGFKPRGAAPFARPPRRPLEPRPPPPSLAPLFSSKPPSARDDDSDGAGLASSASSPRSRSRAAEGGRAAAGAGGTAAAGRARSSATRRRSLPRSDRRAATSSTRRMTRRRPRSPTSARWFFFSVLRGRDRRR